MPKFEITYRNQHGGVSAEIVEAKDRETAIYQFGADDGEEIITVVEAPATARVGPCQ
jgi:hypothetical protein